MGQSVRDQLLQLGLVDEKQAKKAEQGKRQAQRSRRQQQKRRKSGDTAATVVQEPPDTRERARQLLQSRAEKDRDAARKRRVKEERAALKAQIRQIIDKRKEPRSQGDVPYNFVVGKKIKRIYVTQKLVDGLSAGRLGVVRTGEQFEVVGRETAQRLSQLDPAVVVSLHDPATAVDDDYADKPIPDDLMW